MSVIPEPGYLEAAVDALALSTDRSDRRTCALPARWARRLQAAAVGLAFPAVLLLLWELSARYGWLPAQILPDPRLVVETIQEFVASGELLDDTRISLMRVAQGFLFGGLAGLLLGVAMGLWPRFQAYVDPLFLAVSQVPTLGWMPLLILLVGIDEELKVIIIAWSAFIPVTLNTYRGIRAVPARYREVGQVLTFGPWSTLTKIVLPAALPTIFVGIREGLANSWQTLVAAELFASSEGLGYLMAWGRQLFQLDLVIMAMIAVGAIGLLFNWGLGSIERRLRRWQVAS
ncbi:MAG TPA: ABC transporter permease [Candidatus Angelobacter sp.]|nr:ABC transporter permease [Candidatus Angelobacter sp.]